MNRLFYENAREGETVTVSGDDAKHLQVLRVNGGDVLPVSDGKGTLLDGTVVSVGSHTYTLALSDARAATGETADVTLYQALCKGDKNEQILQKSVELGVTRVVFFVSANCVARPEGKESAKLDRYGKVARLACMQSGREKLVEVDGFPTFDEVVERIRGTQALFCYEKADKKLSEALRGYDGKPLSLVVGSEGGFTPDEAAKMAQAGAEPLSLGRRILRAETAPVAALAVIMASLGEL